MEAVGNLAMPGMKLHLHEPVSLQQSSKARERWRKKLWRTPKVSCRWKSCCSRQTPSCGSYEAVQGQIGPSRPDSAFGTGSNSVLRLGLLGCRLPGSGRMSGRVKAGASTENAVVDGSVITGDGSHLESTRRMVETAMLAASAGLAYFLSNMLRLEAYFGCFFPLPIVISSVRWDAAAGRKTMVATATLLLVIAGPLKALTYLLMHGFVGLAMGSLWRWKWNWWVSIGAVTLVRCAGAFCFFALSSWLIRENLLALLMLNAHTSLSHLLASIGLNMVPSMAFVYAAAVSLLLVNCSTFVFLLHILYAVFLRRLGLSGFSTPPNWVDKAN